jgi:hypothetical protein
VTAAIPVPIRPKVRIALTPFLLSFSLHTATIL